MSSTPPGGGSNSGSVVTIVLGIQNTNDCLAGDVKLTEAECQAAANEEELLMGLTWKGVRSKSNRPGGCWKDNFGRVKFNPQTGRASFGNAGGGVPICKTAAAAAAATATADSCPNTWPMLDGDCELTPLGDVYARRMIRKKEPFPTDDGEYCWEVM